MVRKRQILFAAGALIVIAALGFAAFSLLPLNILSIQTKPEQPPQRAYEYYLVIDAESNRTLMYVPLVVSVGDEVITEENKRYQVVRIEENRAYARFVENVDLENYQPKP